MEVYVRVLDGVTVGVAVGVKVGVFVRVSGQKVTLIVTAFESIGVVSSLVLNENLLIALPQ